MSDFRTGVNAQALQSTNTATVTSDELLFFFFSNCQINQDLEVLNVDLKPSH